MHKLVGILWLLLSSTAVWAGDNPLEIMDRLRTQEGTVKVVTRIEVYEQGEQTRSSLLDVYVGTDRRSLAIYRSEREAGQKVLMLDDQFWLFMPSSKRAMRITAMQKMLGEASAGDVASLKWTDDYQVSEQTQEGNELHLSLRAARKGLSYTRVELWQDASTLHPLHADLYLRSGKLAKQATFELAQQDNDWRIVSMALQDRVQKDQKTIIYYDTITPMDMPDKWFTPNYLLKSNVE
jgi:hypothetical protein